MRVEAPLEVPPETARSTSVEPLEPVPSLPLLSLPLPRAEIEAGGADGAMAVMSDGGAAAQAAVAEAQEQVQGQGQMATANAMVAGGASTAHAAVAATDTDPDPDQMHHSDLPFSLPVAAPETETEMETATATAGGVWPAAADAAWQFLSSNSLESQESSQRPAANTVVRGRCFKCGELVYKDQPREFVREGLYKHDLCPLRHEDRFGRRTLVSKSVLKKANGLLDDHSSHPPMPPPMPPPMAHAHDLDS